MFNDFSSDLKNVFKGNIFSLIKRYIFLTFYGFIKYLPTPMGDILRAIYLKFFLKKLQTLHINEGITIHFPENISIGNSFLSEYIYLNGYGGIEIGDMVMIGSGSKFYSHDHIFSDITKPMREQGLEKKPIVVKNNVYIGCDVKVLGNVVIHSGAVLGAGSVITSDVPENAIVAGIPAKVIGYRDKIKQELNSTLSQK